MVEQFSVEPGEEIDEDPDASSSFSMDPTPEVDPLASVPLTEAQLQTRASKVDIALNGWNLRTKEGQFTIADQMRTGNEEIIQQRLLTKAMVEERLFKKEFLLEAANNNNFNPSLEAIHQFMEFTPDEITNPDTIAGSLFAKEMISNLPSAQASIDEDPAAHEEMFQFVAGTIRKHEYLRVKLEEIERRRDNRGFFESAQNLVGEFLPGRDRILQRGAQTEAGQQGPVEESFTKSTFLNEQHTVLMLLGNEEFIENIDATVESLYAENPNVAANWLNNMLNRASSNDFYTDAFDVLDLSGFVDIPLLGIGIAKKLGTKAVTAGIQRKGGKQGVAKGKGLGFKPLISSLPTGPAGQKWMASAIGVAKTLGRKKLDVEDIHAARGAPTKAAAHKALKELQAGLYHRLTQVNSVHSAKRLLRDLPTIITPGKILAQAGKLSNEEKRRITAVLDKNAELALLAATRSRTVDGVSAEALEAGLEETINRFRKEYSGQANDIIDVVDATPDKNVINAMIAGVRIGKGGRPFKGADAVKQADKYAERVGIPKGAYKVQQEGDNVYITVFKPIDQTTQLFREAMVRASPTPLSFRNMFGSLAWGNDEQVSAAFRQNAKVATLAQNNYTAYAKEMFKPIREGMTRSQKKDLEHYLEIQRSHERFDGNGKFVGVGRFDNTVADFELGFNKTHGRFPEANETLGYFAYRQLNDLDLLTNNFGIYRDKAREGVERHILRRPSVQGQEDVDGVSKLINTGGIEGRLMQMDEIDFKDVDANYLFHNPVSADNDGKSITTLVYGRNAQPDIERRVQEIMDNGGRIIKLNHDGQNVASKEFTQALQGDVPDFIITRDIKTGPLELSQIPNNPGGHNMYPDGSFLKQANLLKTAIGRRYAGDRAIINFAHHNDAVSMAKTMEKARAAFQAGDLKAFNKAIADTPFSEKEARGWFNPTKGDQGEIIAPFLDKDTPILAARSGETTQSLMKFDKDVIVKQNQLDQGVSAAFATQRNKPLETVRGTMDTPMWDVREAEFVPVFATLQQSLDTIANARFMDDFKFRAQEAFHQEFGDLFADVGGLSGVDYARNFPAESAMNDIVYKTGGDGKRLAAARAQERIIRQISGQETKYQRNVRQYFQKSMDVMHENLGAKSVDLMPDFLLPMLQDPARYARNIAFHSKLGLFNPVQLFLQAQGAVNMVALAGPKIAWAAAPAATQMIRLGFTNHAGTIRHFAKMNAKVTPGWKAEHFEEAYNALSESGFLRVAGEVAQRDTQRASILNQGRFGTALSKSEMFFNGGERFNRAMGYTASYRKWRDINPTAAFNRNAQDFVLDQADTFSGNMTRVSNAAWQKGWLSVPTQFMAYQARIMEQMLPAMFGGAKRISGMEKLRMFGLYSAAYGVPTALGVGSGVLPWYEHVRGEVLKAGIATPETLTDEIIYALHQGIVSTAFRAAGHGMDTNFAERFGPGGVDIFSDWLNGNKSLYEVATGVSGSVLGDILASSQPNIMNLVKLFSGDPVSAPMAIQDFQDLVGNVSSLAAVTRFFIAVNTRKYYTRNSTLLSEGEQGVLEAGLQALTGLTRLQQADDFLRIDMLKVRKLAQKEGMAQISKWLKLSVREDTSEAFLQELWKRSGDLSVRLELNSRQNKQLFKQSFGIISLSESVGVDFADAFATSLEHHEKLLTDVPKGQE